MPWYAYGLCGSEPPTSPQLRGLDDRPVEVLGDGPVRLVASRVSADVEGLAGAATDVVVGAVLRHDEVLVRLSRQRTVLPARFGTVLPDDGAVEELLADADGSLARQLAHVGGAAEWVVTVAVRSDDEESSAPADPQDLTPHLPPGHAYFARRRAAAQAGQLARDRAVAAASSLADALESMTRGFVPLDLRDRDEVGRGAYLVPNDAVDRLHGLVASTRAHADVALDGPLPAYRFAAIGP